MTVLLLAASVAQGGPRCESVFADADGPNAQTLYRRLLFIAATTAGTLAPTIALAGGFSGSGGEGMAIFPGEAPAAAARDQRGRFGEIKTKLLSSAKILALEHWDLLRGDREPLPVSPGESADSILARARENLRFVSPILAAKFEELEASMSFSTWQKVADLPIVEDVFFARTPRRSELPVQVAIRLSKGNGTREGLPLASKPDIKVLYNQALFDRMDSLDQAMIRFHEPFYALGEFVGLKDSDEVRKFVASFFSKDLEEKRLSGRRAGADRWIQQLRRELELYYRDYPLMFCDPREQDNGPARSARRHLSVLQSILREMKERLAQATPPRRPPPRPNEYYFPKPPIPQSIIHEFATREDFSPEKAFVFFTHFILDREHGVVNSEWLMDPSSSEKAQREELARMCSLLLHIANGTSAESIAAVPSFGRAVEYCR